MCSKSIIPYDARLCNKFMVELEKTREIPKLGGGFGGVEEERMRRREDGVVSGDMDRVSFAARLCVSVPDKCAVFVDLDNLDPVFRFEYDYAIVSEDDEIGKALKEKGIDLEELIGQGRDKTTDGGQSTSGTD